jgi:hypothetical protein
MAQEPTKRVPDALRLRRPRSADVTAAIVLRSALASRRDGGLSEAHAARVMRTFCDAAQRRQLPVSSLIVSIKHAWLRSADVHRLPPHEAWVLLDRLVTGCVGAFYAGVRGDAARE